MIRFSRDGNAERLTVDHTPDQADEFQRLGNFSGKIENGRLEGTTSPFFAYSFSGLAVSRAFGDKDHIQFGVIADPHVSCTVLTPTDSHVVIASDGVRRRTTFLISLALGCPH